jgi:hypothetical protein
LDMTRRDLQGEMKRQGRPWEIGKALSTRRHAQRSHLLRALATLRTAPLVCKETARSASRATSRR